ncbi:MAG: PEGA domain-containing protein [Myxococcota bacterium]
MPLAWPALLATLAAAPGPLAIVDVDAPDLMMGLGAQVTRSIVQAAEAQKLKILKPEELRAKVDPKKYELLRKCAGNVACAADVLSQLGVARVVTGKLDRDEKNYLLKLWLLDLKALSVVADVDRPILIAARRFQKDVDQVVPPLLRGEREARGSLTIKSNLTDAQVTVDGEFVGVTPVTLTVKPGKHEVKLERKKYLPITRLLDVEPNKETVESFKLLLKPGEIADEDVVPGLVKKDGPAAPDTRVRLSWYTYVAGGTALVAGGLGLYFGLTARSQEKALLNGYDEATMVYQGTRQDALTAQSNATAANIAFGVAGAAAAATVVFIILDVKNPVPVDVAPVATPGGAGVLVGGRF